MASASTAWVAREGSRCNNEKVKSCTNELKKTLFELFIYHKVKHGQCVHCVGVKHKLCFYCILKPMQ